MTPMTASAARAATTSAEPPILAKLPGARPGDLGECWSGSPGSDLMWASYSFMFPEGELFFIRSLKRCVGAVTDPRMRQEAEGFVAQEAYHTTEHRHLNDLLRGLGADVNGFYAYFRTVRLKLERASALWNLARTCAAEHLTSLHCLASHRNRWLDACKSEAVRRLWYWHLQEELEHRSVCVDVLRAVGGSYWVRVLAFAEVLPRMAWYQSRAMRCYLRGRPFRQQLAAYLSFAGMILRMRGKWQTLRELFAYLRPSYHPRQLPGDPVIAYCRARFGFALAEASGAGAGASG